VLIRAISAMSRPASAQSTGSADRRRSSANFQDSSRSIMRATFSNENQYAKAAVSDPLISS
jgi:hypothetical protein